MFGCYDWDTGSSGGVNAVRHEEKEYENEINHYQLNGYCVDWWV